MNPALAAALETYYRLLATWNGRSTCPVWISTDPTPDALDRLLIEPLVAARHVPPGRRG